MSKIAFSGNASGAGIFTIASPNSNENRTLTLPDRSGTIAFNPPAFRGEATTTQSVTSATYTKVAIDTVSATDCFDSAGWFNTTNNRYTPLIAGYYQFKGLLSILGTTQTLQIAAIYKNGSRFGVSSVNRLSNSSSITLSVTELIYMNGSTDYVELYGLITATSPSFSVSAPLTSTLEGFLVRAT